MYLDNISGNPAVHYLITVHHVLHQQNKYYFAKHERFKQLNFYSLSTVYYLLLPKDILSALQIYSTLYNQI